MQIPSPHAAPMPDRRWPAWILSVALHGCAILALAIGLESVPRGASEELIRSAGIVLKRSSAEGTLYGTEQQLANDNTREQQSETSESVFIQADHPLVAQAGVGTQPPLTPTSSAPPASEEDQANTPRQTAAAGLRGSPNAGDSYAKVSVFGVQGTGNKFVYVFDRSASMEGPPLAAAKRQLIESLKSLDTLHQFHIIFFNHRLRSFDITSGGRRIAFASDRNKKLAANFVGGITADGGTDRFVALKQALAYRPDVIFFLTDADDPMSASELREIERVHSRIGTSICVIEFGRSAAEPQKNFLTELARLSGGQYGYVDTTKLTP
jgi:hypothetical protein